MSTLVIVESPTKARTIRNYLPKDYRVEASMGHVRDLPQSASEIPANVKGETWAQLGVNVDADFEPVYVVPKDKKKIVTGKVKALVGIYTSCSSRKFRQSGWCFTKLPKTLSKKL
jgi:DNA topoisomerase I